ncbi:hypothetical protein CMV_013418 [Castanea mollissima]|uniref:Glutathione peroxidase n=1 Tax=Castanea mollissima TaxID=60419 RepID=A0A8J4R1P9_9ROSI|nr:hypothetical protein CMV_013418 [Castanea mollissima]
MSTITLQKCQHCINILIISFFFLYLYTNPSSLLSHNMAENTSKSIYDFTVKDIRGNDVSLSEYNGKVLLIVNVASKCGLTQTNYKELNVLYEKYKNQGFEILAFPCNQFLGQEPGNNEAIQEVACTMFKAEFPIFDKVEVNGKNAAPIYKRKGCGAICTNYIPSSSRERHPETLGIFMSPKDMHNKSSRSSLST